MKQIVAGCEPLPLLVLCTLAERGHSEKHPEQLLATPNHYCVKEDGIVTLSQERSVAKARLSVLPQTCSFGQNEYLRVQEKLKCLVNVLTSSGIRCYRYQRSLDEWYFELTLGVSSHEHRALYRLKAVSHSDAYHSERNEVILDVALFALGIDSMIVSTVQMVDEILHSLMRPALHARSTMKHDCWPIKLLRTRF